MEKQGGPPMNADERQSYGVICVDLRLSAAYTLFAETVRPTSPVAADSKPRIKKQNWPPMNADERRSPSFGFIGVDLRLSAAKTFFAETVQPTSPVAADSKPRIKKQNWPPMNADERRSPSFGFICVDPRLSAANTFFAETVRTTSPVAADERRFFGAIHSSAAMGETSRPASPEAL